ncbi:MAG: primosomal protein N' [Chthonomonadales bacterium]|nr:primosomal protein N' [Chthonomonadales bacterium]
MLTGSLWEEFAGADVADVVVDVEAPDLLPAYTYLVPEGLREVVRPGVCVQVPFGGQSRAGYVVALRRVPPDDPLFARLLPVAAIVEGAVTVIEKQIALARWVADRYVADLPSAMRCIAPAAMGSRVATFVRFVRDSAEHGAEPEADGCARAPVQSHILATLRRLGGEAEIDVLRAAAQAPSFSAAYGALLRKRILAETARALRPRAAAATARAYTLGVVVGTLNERPSAAAARILDALAGFQRRGEAPVPGPTLLAAADAAQGALRTLTRKGAVVACQVPRRRAPLRQAPTPSAAPLLTAGQRAAVARLGGMMAAGEPGVALLHGVTASGKTEVYLDAIARTLAAGRTAIVLVPEIALTAQVVEVFTARFGDEVAVLHSRLSMGEHHDEWRRLQEGSARIAVGARSAVFAPLERLGLVVVDEEHEASYKQESQPRYHARETAMQRGADSGALVVLGSATPSLESYHAAAAGRFALVEMPERVDARPLPAVSVVDLREEIREHRALFSRELLGALAERLARRQQSILFLNRRGYAQFVLCRDCGFVARCPNCAVSLTYHAAESALRCHHCDYARSAPTLCPDCGGRKVKSFGIGTERVEEEVLAHFPDARVVRLDRDTVTRKGAHAGILGRFRRGEADVLIGTQMVAKGLDFPNVTLVGVITADTGIHMPDFRAAERTFQLLTQVAGRAGRGEHPGSVVIQTFSPDHYGVQRAVEQDYAGFYAREIRFREELGYPPFRRLANLVVADPAAAGARDRCEGLAAALRATLPREIELIGPAPAPLARLRGRYRRHIVLRAPVEAPLSTLVQQALASMASQERHGIVVDIDPVGMA